MSVLAVLRCAARQALSQVTEEIDVSAIGELSRLKGRPKGAVGRKDNLVAYLFLTPWLLGLLLITIGPMIASLYLAFTDYNLIQAPEWIGFENFRRML